MSRAFLRFPLTSGGAWLLAYFGARIGLELTTLPVSARILIAVIPAVPFAWFLSGVVRGAAGLDELHRKVHFEALAIAFPVVTLILMTLGLLELAVVLPREDLSYRHVWGFVPMVYFASLAIVWRKYQ